VTTYVGDFDVSQPLPTELASSVDDDIRAIKATIKATFPAITGVMNADQAALNLLGVPIDVFPSGTKMFFYDAAPPVGWNLDTHAVADNNSNQYYVRINVNTAGNYTAGQGAEASWPAYSGTSDPHVLTPDEIPDHTHNYEELSTYSGGVYLWYSVSSVTNKKAPETGSFYSTGGSLGHTHDITVKPIIPGVGYQYLPYFDCCIGVKA